MTDQSKPDRQDGDGLLPCPFCKYTDARVSLDRSIFAGQTYVDEPGDEGWKIRCEKCGCQTCWWHKEQQAIEVWNTRATPDAAKSAGLNHYRCKFCGDFTSTANTPPHCPDCGRLSATPQPAPDAMRNALEAARSEIVLTIAFLGRDEGTGRMARTISSLISRLSRADEAIRKALSAPVPPAGGAGEAMSDTEVLDTARKLNDAITYKYSDEGSWRSGPAMCLCQALDGFLYVKPLPSSPSGAPAAEPITDWLVDWTYLHATEGQQWPSSKTKSMLIARAMQGEPTQDHADRMKVVATPPVRGDREAIADDIRMQGWSVAVHNDYQLSNLRHTFWLFTKDGRAVKGEGRTDADALNQVRAVLSLPVQSGAGERP